MLTRVKEEVNALNPFSILDTKAMHNEDAIITEVNFYRVIRTPCSFKQSTLNVHLPVLVLHEVHPL